MGLNQSMKRISAVVALSGLAMGVPAAHAAKTTAARTAGSGSASGTVTVNEKTSKIAFAYAHEVKGFFDPTKPDIEVILSDVALSAKALTSFGERGRLADAGRIHTFEITINRSGKPVSSAFYNNGFGGASPSGLDSSDALTVKMLAAASIDAKYKSSGVHEFFGNRYSFDVAFQASITKK